MQSIEIEILSRNADFDTIEHITNIVNRVYAKSEKGLWLNGALRTTVEEVKEFVRREEIAVARIMNQIVGCIRICQIDKETGEFGMLAVAEEYQGNGIGRKLIHYAEEKFRKEQYQKIQLELLVPKKGNHPAKVILEKWYTRIGYRPVHTDSIESLIPKMAQMLAIPCKFIVFQKEIT